MTTTNLTIPGPGDGARAATTDAVRLSPAEADPCWYCGGAGFVHSCLTLQCRNADLGCDACSSPCEVCNAPAFRP